MNERMKKIFSVSPLKITILVIFFALVMFFIDVPFLRVMELKALDLRMSSRGTLPTGEKRLSPQSMKRVSANWADGRGPGRRLPGLSIS